MGLSLLHTLLLRNHHIKQWGFKNHKKEIKIEMYKSMEASKKKLVKIMQKSKDFYKCQEKYG